MFYALPDAPEAGDPEALPPLVRPLVALEARALGHVYLNVLAVDDDAQGRGVARALLEAFEEAARTAGRPKAIIVDDAKTRAFDLYRSLGYREIARAAIVTNEDWSAEGTDWVLLTKA